MKNMKYLLRLLGALTLTGLSVTTLAACGGASNSNTKFDISKMTTADFVSTKNNIIAVNSSSVSKEEVISGIKSSILESVKKFTQNKEIAEADFTITLAANAQGGAYQPLNLSVNTGSTFVQITSNTKILGIGNKTKGLSYALPIATTITNLKDLGEVIPPPAWIVGDITKIKEKEIMSVISPNILVAVQAINHNSSIVAGDITIQVALDKTGSQKIPTPFDWGADLTKIIYFQVSSTGNPAVIGKTNENKWLSFLLKAPTDKKIDLNDLIKKPGLGKIVAKKDSHKDVKPSTESILLVVNELNNVNLTENNVKVDVTNNQEAVIKGEEKGPYSGSSVAVTFTTMPVITTLGEINTHGKLPEAAEIMDALNEVNVGYTTGWEILTSSTFEIVNPVTTLAANVKVLDKNFKGILDLSFTISASRVDITDFAFVPPTDIVFDPKGTDGALVYNAEIQKAVVNGINQNLNVDISRNDFTLAVENKTNVQEIRTPIKITVTAYPTSDKITGSFVFYVYLKVDITFASIAIPLEVPVAARKTNAVLIEDIAVERSVDDAINLLNKNLNLSANDYVLALFDPSIATDLQIIDAIITIVVTANSTSSQITGAFIFDVTLIA